MVERAIVRVTIHYEWPSPRHEALLAVIRSESGARRRSGPGCDGGPSLGEAGQDARRAWGPGKVAAGTGRDGGPGLGGVRQGRGVIVDRWPHWGVVSGPL